MLGFLKKSPPALNLALDIGSGSVGGALFEKDGADARLIHCAREPIAFQDRLTGEGLTAAMLVSLAGLISKLDKYLASACPGRPLERAAAVFASPWHVSESKVLTLEFNAPTTVTDEAIGKLIDADDAALKERLAGKHAEGNPLALLERAVMAIRLNDYDTARPYGKEATTASVAVFESLIAAQTLSAARHIVERLHPTGGTTLHSFPSVAGKSMSGLSNLKHFFVARIGGELTEIILVRDGVIAATGSFPSGRAVLERSLKRACGVYPHAAIQSFFSLYKDKVILERDAAMVEEALASARNEWLESFRSVFTALSGAAVMPRDVFIFEEENKNSPFGNWLSEAAPERLWNFAEPLTVTILDKDTVPFFAGYYAACAPDASLAMAASFVADGAAL